MTRFQPQWLQAGSYSASQDRRLIGALWPGPASAGCLVSATSGMALQVAAGSVAVPASNNTGTVLCTSDAFETVTLPAANPTLPRIDLVVCQPRSVDLGTGSQEDWWFTSVQGVAASSPAVPATPANMVAIAQVLVPAGAASIVAGNITDVRPGGMSVASSLAPASAPRGWVAGVTGPATAISAGATQTTILTVSGPVIAGRRYRISVLANGAQSAVAGSARAQMLDDQGGVWSLAYNYAIPASGFLLTPGHYYMTATSTRTATWQFVALTTAGTLTFSANLNQMWVEDMGG